MPGAGRAPYAAAERQCERLRPGPDPEHRCTRSVGLAQPFELRPDPAGGLLIHRAVASERDREGE